MGTAAKGRGGRKPKGVRSPIICRVPVEQKPVMEEAARQAGLPLSDYVARILAEFHQLPVPDYVRPKDEGQNRLDLRISA